MALMNKIIACTILLTSWISVCGQMYADKQYYLIDSLEINILSDVDKELLDQSLDRYHTATTDTGRIEALALICEGMMNDKWILYQRLQNKMIDESILLNQTDSVVKRLKLLKSYALNNIGYYFKIQANLDSALYYYLKAEANNGYEGDEQGRATNINNIGVVYFSQGDLSRALKFCYQSLKIRESINDETGIAASLNNIGAIHEDHGDVEMALANYIRALEIEERLGNKYNIPLLLNNLGMIYMNNGEYDKSRKYFQRCLMLYIEYGDKDGAGMAYNNMGFLLKKLSKSDSALIFFKKSYELHSSIQAKQGMALALHNIADNMLIRGEIMGKEGALAMANQSLDLSLEIGYVERIRDVALLLSDIYSDLNQGMHALDMHKLHIQMKDSINNTETQKSAIKQATKYEYEKKKAIDDKENEKKVAIEKETQKRQFIVLVIVIIASALVLILLVIIYRRLRITRKQKLVIEEQKEEVETQRDQIEGQKNEIEVKHEEIQESITYAKRIQNAILPPDSFISEHLSNNFVYYQPKDVVAGDFYWMEVHNDIVFFAAADCTGHGVPGAMVSVVCHNALNRAVREFGLRDTGKILDKVRELVLITFEKSEEQMKDGMDICLCALNKKSNSLQFSGANNPLYLIKDGELETIKGTKQPIGHVQDPRPFESHNIDLKDIHSFYLTTDGYADQFGGPKNKKFTYKQLRELLEVNHYKPMNEQHDILKSELNNWIKEGDDEQIDDVCMIGVKI